ncbi:MAG: metallophosphoesterase [Lachnospiraceae bacterium]|nr:metallophosphoesterase [Lachnospiraceae bacterium]
MRALVISDTHRYLDNAEKVIEKYRDINTVIHLGDMVEDAEKLKREFNDREFHYVAGNNDFSRSIPFEKMIILGGKKILLTHGHRQRVNCNMLSISLWGREQEADVVLFGHIHQPVLDESMGIMLFNPGSISLPRSTQYPTYGILEVRESGIVQCKAFQLCAGEKEEKIF